MRAAAPDRAAPDGPTAGRLRRAVRHARAHLGGMLAIVVLLSLIAAALAPEPLAPLMRLRGGEGGRPSWLAAHLPSDRATIGFWTAMLHAAWPSLSVALAATAAALAIGAPIGMLAGARALSWIGRPLRGALAVAEAFPPLLLALVALVALDAAEGARQGWAARPETRLALVLALRLAPRIARIADDEIRRAAHAPHVGAARALGASTLRIAIHGVAPRCLRALVAGAAGLVGPALLMETTLSFLGFGMPADRPSWGTLLAAGVRPMQAANWLPVVAPAGLVLLAACAVGILARALRAQPEPGRAR